MMCIVIKRILIWLVLCGLALYAMESVTLSSVRGPCLHWHTVVSFVPLVWFDVFFLTGCSTLCGHSIYSAEWHMRERKISPQRFQCVCICADVYVCEYESPCYGQLLNIFRVISKECACAISVIPLKTSSQRKTVKIIIRLNYRIIYQKKEIMIISIFCNNKSFQIYWQF